MRRLDRQPSILYVQANGTWGSCEAYLATLIRGVASGRPEWGLSVWVPQETHQQWKQAVGSAARLARAPEGVFRSALALHALGPALVHVNDPAVVPLAACRLARIPTVVTYHTPEHRICYNARGRVLRWFGLAHSGVHFIVLSKANKEALETQQALTSHRISIIPHGLDASPFFGLAETASARKALGLAAEDFVLISVGRLAAQKAHDVLFQAVALARSRTHVPLRLLVVGEGELRTQLRDRVEQLGIGDVVRWLGWRRDVPQVLRAADVFVLSSDFEGLPFAVLEAMAAGLPIISTAVGGLPDIIHDGIGRLVPRRRPDLLAEAILALFERPDSRKDMGRHARDEFLRCYRAERMVQDTVTLYESILRSTGARVVGQAA